MIRLDYAAACGPAAKTAAMSVSSARKPRSARSPQSSEWMLELRSRSSSSSSLVLTARAAFHWVGGGGGTRIGEPIASGADAPRARFGAGARGDARAPDSLLLRV